MHRLYTEGQHAPERGSETNWHVWCKTGACQVLTREELEAWFQEHPDQPFGVNFANGAFARLEPGDDLHKKMAELSAEGYGVEVFPITSNEYVQWSGDACSFDAIKVMPKG